MQIKKPILFVLLTIPLSIKAQITTDGTLGQSINLPGPDYQIGANLGQQHGGNLFHSFQDFNLNNEESATFSGPNHIQNVISRVTGGNPSNIDGLIRSTIPNADMYFLNPYGIFFGPNAKLDVQGSFHASTADYLRLGEGGRFDARNPSDSLLTVAPIEAFGFFDSPASLSIDGSQLTVPFEKTLSIISGNLTINQAQLTAPFGRINLASIAERGDVIPKYEDFVVPALRGNITAQSSQISTSGEGGGTIYIRGGQFELINSVVESDMLGDQNGGVINIQVDRLVAEGIEKLSKISAQTLGTGQGGTVQIEARQIALNDGAAITGDTYGSGTGGNVSIKVADTLSISGQYPSSGSPSTISANTISSNGGNAGYIDIKAGNIILTDGGSIQSITLGSGKGGNIKLVTDTLTILGGFKIPQAKFLGEIAIKNLELLPSSIGTSALRGSGNAGTIDLTAHQIILKNGGQITGTTGYKGQGQGGSIHIKVTDTLTAKGEYIGHVTFGSGISSNSSEQQAGSGNGGAIEIEAGELVVSEGATITSDTLGSGTGGNISIKVAGTLIISGQSHDLASPSSISVSTIGLAEHAGNAGHLNIEAGQLILTDGGAIRNVTLGTGNGGDITILVTDTLTIADGYKIPQTEIFGEQALKQLELLPSGIAASSLNGPGNAGTIDLSARQIILKNGGQITSSTWHQGQGGSIKIKVSDTLLATGEYLGNIAFHSGIVSNSNYQQTDAGNGGTIEIEAGQIELNSGADINSETAGTGIGGNILIKVADTLSISGQAASSGSPSSISASALSSQANAGNAGHLNIEAGQMKLTDGGAIQNITMGPGNGGDVTLLVTDTLIISGGFKISQTKMFGEIEITDDRLKLLPSGIAASSLGGSGKAGTIDLITRQLILQEGGEITSSTLEQGQGGSINVKVTDSVIAKGRYIGNIIFYSGMRTNSLSQQSEAGNAGHIEVQANTINLTNEGRISTSATNAGGGHITITAPNILYLQQGQITTSVSGGKGGGGNITVTNPLFVVLNDGQIIAQADEGHGGNIQIISDQLMSSQESLIDASSRKGIDGVVFVSAPETDMSGQLLVLSTNFVNAADQMHPPCSARVAENLSHFVVAPREGTATQPDDLLPSGPLFKKPKPTNTKITQKDKSTTATRSLPLALLFECRSKAQTTNSSTKGKSTSRESSIIPDQLF